VEGTGGRKRGKGDGPQDKRIGSGKGNKWWKRAKKENAQGGVLPTSTTDLEKEEAEIGEEKDKDEEAERPFELNNLKFVVPKGAFIGIIGRVGCGKVRVLIWLPP
jgi:ATP-binding cassette subfamily C (CFTR/MRP) protein 1